MKSQWNDLEAQKFADNAGAGQSRDLALRLYTGRLLGSCPDLVLHGGGNVSVKESLTCALGKQIDVLCIKASGAEMSTLSAEHMPAVKLQPLKELEALESLSDREMVNELRLSLLDASAPTPSIETLVHAWLPHRYIDHSHADAVLALTNQSNGAALIQEAVGDKVGVVPYTKPGFALAKSVMAVFRQNPKVEGIVLLHHGLITFADDAQTSYERHIEIVNACEALIEERAGSIATAKPINSAFPRAHELIPVIRGALAWPTGDEDLPFMRSVVDWRHDAEALALAESAKAHCATGPLTGDHLIRTKSNYLYLGDICEADSPRNLVDRAVGTFRQEYARYVEQHGHPTEGLDPSPRVVIAPKLGILASGHAKSDARIAADIAVHTLRTKNWANAVGTYESLGQDQLFDMEFRAIQRLKLDSSIKPLKGQVVVVSGGAGAIGAAVSVACARAGAGVAITDIDADRIEQVVSQIESECGDGSAVGVTVDVTDEASVAACFSRVVEAFGGVDIAVPNAGIAHVAPIADLKVDDFRRVMEVNATGYLLFMQQAVRVMKLQATGGHVIINASKNVFGPGKDFGAYSASKAAGHQLGKVAALELAEEGIRVNMINADAVFGDARTPSGLWKTVGPQRAKSRSLKEQDLPEYYRNRNLLKARVKPEHVASAVLFFATNATPTTGATLPVDGGVVEAFPR